jgi:exopolysaccharide production protein ExoZ
LQLQRHSECHTWPDSDTGDWRRLVRLLSVEAARGAAAVLVLLVHSSAMLAAPKYFGQMSFYGLFKFGHAGVDFFFVLSGFIIFHVHRTDLGNPARLGRYLGRRFVRIFPTYWAVLFILGLILVVSPTRGLYERDVVAVVANVFLLPVPHHMIIHGVAWTLQHEVLFYALFSVLFFRISVGIVVLAVWAALIIWQMLTGDFQTFPAIFLFSTFNIQFFFGIAAAAALWRLPPFRPVLMLSAGTVLFLATGLAESFIANFPSQSPGPHLLYAAGAALALYGMAAGECTGKLRTVPGWAVSLGTASYSIYLLHVIIIMILQQVILVARRFVPMPLDLTFAGVVAITLVICLYFSHFVEQPLLAWSRRVMARKHAVRTAG